MSGWEGESKTPDRQSGRPREPLWVVPAPSSVIAEYGRRSGRERADQNPRACFLRSPNCRNLLLGIAGGSNRGSACGGSDLEDRGGGEQPGYLAGGDPFDFAQGRLRTALQPRPHPAIFISGCEPPLKGFVLEMGVQSGTGGSPVVSTTRDARGKSNLQATRSSGRRYKPPATTTPFPIDTPSGSGRARFPRYALRVPPLSPPAHSVAPWRSIPRPLPESLAERQENPQGGGTAAILGVW
jgi:hypothetical protein